MLASDYYLKPHLQDLHYITCTIVAALCNRFPFRRLCLTYLATAQKVDCQFDSFAAPVSMRQDILYDSAFYNSRSEGSLNSAKHVLPLVKEWIQPNSVVDVGCGTGAWLLVWQELGIEDYLGIDGQYVERQRLLIPPETFLAKNLVEPFRLSRKYDLAMSLEVAEHLPPESADGFIESLICLSDAILFSAAIPFQGGTGHLNEQWKGYWVERFQQRGYIAIDCLRPRIWDNYSVEPWYSQNALLFIKSDCLQDYPQLPSGSKDSTPPLDIVHPRAYHNSLGYYTQPLKSELARIQAELAQSQQALLTAQAEIAAMQTSKFWWLRTRWMDFKRKMKNGQLKP